MSEEKRTSIAEAEELSRQMAEAAAELAKQTADLRRDQEDAAAELAQHINEASAELNKLVDKAAYNVRELIPEDADDKHGENTIKFRTKKVAAAKKAEKAAVLSEPSEAPQPSEEAQEPAEEVMPSEEPEAPAPAAETPAEPPQPEKKTRKQLRAEKRAQKQAEKAAKKAESQPAAEAETKAEEPDAPAAEAASETEQSSAEAPAAPETEEKQEEPVSEQTEKPEPEPEEKPYRPEEDPELIRLVKLEEAKLTARAKAGTHRKGVGFISSVLFVAAILFAVYGGIVVFILGTDFWFNFAWLIGAGILLILSFMLSHHSHLPKLLKALLVIILLAICANFGTFLYRDIAFAAEGPAENARWLIVLGAKVNGTSPSVEFQARIDKAAEYVRDADFARLRAKTAALPPLVKIITTGGKGADEGAPEGEVAAKVLLGLGFDQARIFTENTSTTTLENFQNAKQLIIANGGTVFDDVVVVTSSFHLYRAIKLAKACGFTSVTGLGSTGLAVLLPHYYFREYAAIIKEVYLGHFGQ